MTTDPMPPLTRDQREGESPSVLYVAYRHLDRWFDASRRDRHTATLSRIDVAVLSPRVRFLAWHLLVLSRQARPVLDAFPNLRPLAEERCTPTPIEPPLVLSERPRHAWSYLRSVGIHL
ncbi:hypothetical protein [Microbacterium lacticum]|nr:hypothetical protein [Microbacterium lacticum]GEB95180.1 hypothetical protein MLA01_13990 [Microbacterium lacticum]GGN23180.1 hypothetical protein GCM10009724_16880 [Microbacterium lacticum]